MENSIDQLICFVNIGNAMNAFDFIDLWKLIEFSGMNCINRLQQADSEHRTFWCGGSD
jgi:hypothetical protein